MDDDLLTFVNLVRAMRKTQREYFKTRDYNTMMESRKQESLVDRFIKNFDERIQREKDSTALGPELPF